MIRTAVLALLFVLMPAPAQASPTVYVTVTADFDIQGSGWRLDQALAGWNNGQTAIRYVRSSVPAPGPYNIYIHHYSAADGYGAYTSGTHIYLNEYYHPRSTWNDPYTICMSAQIVAHEVGHTAALPHSPWVSDLMYGGPRPGPRPSCATPSANDIAVFNAMYP